jgi:hypothetical protein
VIEYEGDLIVDSKEIAVMVVIEHDGSVTVTGTETNTDKIAELLFSVATDFARGNLG